jgi:hypothetical protein
MSITAACAVFSVGLIGLQVNCLNWHPRLTLRNRHATAASPGRHGHSTLALTVIDCHSLGIQTLILLSLLSFPVKLTVLPWANRRRGRRSRRPNASRSRSRACCARATRSRTCTSSSRTDLGCGASRSWRRSTSATVRAALGRLSALSVSLCKSILYGAFVWARRALNSQKRRVSGPGSELAAVRALLPLRADGHDPAGAPVPHCRSLLSAVGYSQQW